MHPILANRRKRIGEGLKSRGIPRKDIRRGERIQCTLPVRLSWSEEHGPDRFGRGECRDISADGLRVETNETIPAQSFVNLRVEKVDVAGSGRVRYTRRGGGMANIIGLELSQKVRQQLLDALRATPLGS
jgi:hypothetical protein